MDEKFTQAVCRIVENDKRYHLTAQKIRAAPVIFQDRNS